MFVDEKGNVDYSGLELMVNLDDSLGVFTELFSDDATFQFRYAANRINPALRCVVIFLDGMADPKIINENIIEPIVSTIPPDGSITAQTMLERIIEGNSASVSSDIKDLTESILYGDTVVIIDGQTTAIKINSKGFALRSVSEPDDEKALRGPREGFTESLMTNASMLRRKLQTSDLKFVSKRFGSRSNTRAFVCYLDSLVNKDILAELDRRLERVDMDGALDVNYIHEYIKDCPRSLFKTCGSTEKPDVAAAKLLEGRIALILDGTPIVLTLPYLFIENLQAADDYYNNFYFGSIGRLLRLLGFFLTISAPAIYMALISFHPEMIPTSLMLSMASAIGKVPFPTVVECVGMLIIFEVLRETGIRTPNKIGSALSIVGALIVGQAAVEAKIVSAPVVIVVALTGITGLMVPRLSSATLALKFIFIAAASFLGFYGYLIVLILLFFYLSGMKSFGMDYTSQMFTYNRNHLKDIYLRSPIPVLNLRPLHMSEDDKR